VPKKREKERASRASRAVGRTREATRKREATGHEVAGLQCRFAGKETSVGKLCEKDATKPERGGRSIWEKGIGLPNVWGLHLFDSRHIAEC